MTEKSQTEDRARMLSSVADYYSAKLAEHGESARGVDWNGTESQLLRFKQLTKVISSEPFSVNDLGCGYGALLVYLKQEYGRFSYSGYDISREMIAAARSRYKEEGNFAEGSVPSREADYGMASGIFNVRLASEAGAWQKYIDETLDALDRTSRLGFAFNCLTSYSDQHKMRDYLHYADPCAVFERCKRRYARNVALLHDYGLYEFTILVRKNL